MWYLQKITNKNATVSTPGMTVFAKRTQQIISHTEIESAYQAIIEWV